MIEWIQTRSKWGVMVLHLAALVLLLGVEQKNLQLTVLAGLLLLSFWLIWLGHRHQNSIAAAALGSMVVGWTLLLFANYFQEPLTESDSLPVSWGPGLFGVPLIYGVMYFLYAYSSSALAGFLFISSSFRVVAGILIQVVAMSVWFPIGWKLGAVGGESVVPSWEFWVTQIVLAVVLQAIIYLRFAGMNNPSARMFLMMQLGLLLVVNLFV